MGILLTATFDTRREADMTVERIVQTSGLAHAVIFVAADDEGGGLATPLPDADAALESGVIVSVEVADEAEAHTVAEAFEAFNSSGVVVSCIDEHDEDATRAD